jgi:hypothetical protein
MYYVNPDPLPDRATDPAGHAAEVMKRVCSVLETDEYNADTTDALAEIMRGAGYDIDRPERDYSNEDWKAELEAGDEIRVGDESWTLVTGPIECDDEDDDHFGELAFVAQHSVTLETEQFWASEIS